MRHKLMSVKNETITELLSVRKLDHAKIPQRTSSAKISTFTVANERSQRKQFILQWMLQAIPDPKSDFKKGLWGGGGGVEV